MTNHDDTTRLRRMAYALLLTVAAGMAAGRIFAVERVNEPSLHKPDKADPRPLSVWPAKLPNASPLFGSNDRSRWATMRALVDHGTYAIGERIDHADGTYADRSSWRESGWEADWDTVDKVLDPKTHKFYSSKPPLLATALAGLYWLLQQITGWTLADNLWEVVRTMLLLVNVLPFLLYLHLLGGLAEHYARSDWARLFVVTAACFATLVTPFLVTLNNHNIATYCVLFAMVSALAVWRIGASKTKPEALVKGATANFADASGSDNQSAPRWYHFAFAGLFSSFAATCELPAAAFAVGLGLVLLLRNPGRTLLFFVPCALLPVAGFFWTNWLAIGEFSPAYSHFGTAWYTYPGSHWEKVKRGIDFAAHVESRGAYTFNVLLGHHGLFSLTPIWLLAFAGMVFGLIRLVRGQKEMNADSGLASAPERLPWWFFPAALLLSLVVIGFYLTRPVGERNYGGWTSGLRWLMWLTPIWLVSMLPVLDKLSRCRWGRSFGYILLALSVLSASYPAWNPWRHPWIYRFMDANGWIPY